MADPDKHLKAADALLVVDVQQDFFPGGSLPVPDADQVFPELNRWIETAHDTGIPIIASRDWHPRIHCSFREQGGQWPVHCVQGTAGAAFHPDLKLPSIAQVLSKGKDPAEDNDSAFQGTGLIEMLKARGVRRVWIGGLAQEVCVKATVLDGLEAGFEVHVLLKATRAVNSEESSRAVEEMERRGAHLHA